jgi:predicted nucleotidyltransferase
MSIYTIERNGSDCKYVKIFTHRVGSIGAAIRTVFVRGTNTKQWDVPKIAGRDTKANIFRKGSARFKATINLNKKFALMIIIIIIIIIIIKVKVKISLLPGRGGP